MRTVEEYVAEAERLLAERPGVDAHAALLTAEAQVWAMLAQVAATARLTMEAAEARASLEALSTVLVRSEHYDGGLIVRTRS